MHRATRLALVLLRRVNLFAAALCLCSALVWAGGVRVDKTTLVDHSSAAALLAGDQPALLDAAIARYRELAAVGGWQVLPADTRLAPGSRDQRVRQLRQRLRSSGDYQSEMSADPLYFDSGLRAAVMAFQQRHGIPADGTVSGQTLVLLNQPVAARLAQLQQARESWAALPAGSHAGKRVWVNIPEAAVAAIADDHIQLQLRAVVGHPTRPTPQLSSTIRRVIVNPAWTVPQSIAGADVLPRQLKDSQYLQHNGFRVFAGFSDNAQEISPAAVGWPQINPDRFPYRLRQDPGPRNSLGRFKFEFPNDFDVYMHDTPSRALLGLSVRSLSAGCVRVQNPGLLAQWLLPDDPAERQQLAQAAADSRYVTRSFAVHQPVPVDFVYLSAWVSADGQINFRRDVYLMSRPAAERAVLFTDAR